jgi:hypothetical protein
LLFDAEEETLTGRLSLDDRGELAHDRRFAQQGAKFAIHHVRRRQSGPNVGDERFLELADRGGTG